MRFLFRQIFNKVKEYLLLSLLLIISLVVLSNNSKPEVQKIKSYAFASFAVWAELIDVVFSSTDIKSNDLQIENAKLMLQVNRLREYALENSELRALLNFKNNSDYNLIASSVLSKNISNTQGVFLISSGTKDSIKKSMPVLNEKGLIGIVVEVSENYSLIQTLNSSAFKISANIPRSNLNGIVSWNGIELVMKNIPTTADINKGDRVVTSTLSTILPPSIPIGLVEAKESNISGLLSNVIIKPFVEIANVKNVFVLAEVKSSQIDSLELNLVGE
jgi:rod shape-determining protein MreC